MVIEVSRENGNGAVESGEGVALDTESIVSPESFDEVEMSVGVLQARGSDHVHGERKKEIGRSFVVGKVRCFGDGFDGDDDALEFVVGCSLVLDGFEGGNGASKVVSMRFGCERLDVVAGQGELVVFCGFVEGCHDCVVARSEHDAVDLVEGGLQGVRVGGQAGMVLNDSDRDAFDPLTRSRRVVFLIRRRLFEKDATKFGMYQSRNRVLRT